ncbi:MAG: ribonuclease P protein component [Flavobacteriales bacterium]|nr:ribonuclease P protein component [Flavobacteriales bacterium]MCB9193251.1 ribonuclease P protein component [Flavobacteriales bacterium]
MGRKRPQYSPSVERPTFRKHERLSGRKLIEQVVREGVVVHRPPFRITGLSVTDENAYPIRIAFAVPKRRLPRAVDRNRMKRLMREVWRLNKQRYVEHCREGMSCYALLVAFQGRTTMPYAVVEDKMIPALDRWMEQNG